MKVLKELFGSKKFLMALFSMLAIVLNKFFGISEDHVMEIAAIASAYLISQGIADKGKEASKIAIEYETRK